ncbi:hypothetical protein KFE80_01705 [bacterium SCSIO 12696]|nr:hypothetical protein KFE80_01705 [bacterium SCSIO 12696]
MRAGNLLLIPLILFLISACTAIPTTKLDQVAFEKIDAINIETTPLVPDKLSVISSVDVTYLGVGVAATSGDDKGIKPLILDYLEQHKIDLSKIITEQFSNLAKEAAFPKGISHDDQNAELKITINIVVVGMNHGFSDKLNSRFNLSGQLYDDAGNIIWSYTATPTSLSPYSVSYTPDQIFESPESFTRFFSTGSKPIVEKLFKNLSKQI